MTRIEALRQQSQQECRCLKPNIAFFVNEQNNNNNNNNNKKETPY
jgi:hypothetical protein